MNAIRPARPVVVVGGGPTALVASLGLARRGIPVRLLDGPTSANDFGRAWILHAATLEALERVGCGQAIAALATRWETTRVLHKGRDVREERLTESDSTVFPAYVVAAGTRAMEVLWEAVAREPGITATLGAKVLAVIARDGMVKATYEADDGVMAVEGSHLVAADGAESTVRGALGVSFPGRSYDERQLVVEVRAAPRFGRERRIALEPPGGGVALALPVADDRWELTWIMDGQADLLEREERSGQLDRRITGVLEGAEYELIDARVRAIEDRVASKLRVGPVLFAGSAARRIPAVGAWDVNEAIADADGAAWRLALVCRGLAPDSLLADYERERVAANTQARALAEAALRFLVPGSWTSLTARNALLRGAPFTASRQRLAGARLWSPPSLAGSVPAVDTCAASQNLLEPGALAPDGRCLLLPRKSLSRLHAHLGPGFVGVFFPGPRPSLEEFGAWVGERQTAAPLKLFAVLRPEQILDHGRAAGFDALIVDEDRTLRERFGVAEAEAALFVVRPDGYVVARLCDTRAGSFTAALARATGCFPEDRESSPPVPPSSPRTLLQRAR